MPTALITGASSGIGLACAEELAHRGYRLILVARREQALREIADRLGGHDSIALDLSTHGAADEVIAALDGRPVDLLVNNAGFAQYGPFAETDPDEEMAMIQLNVVTLTRLTKRLLPAMIARRSGRILNVASTAAFMPGPLMAVYYATKAYVLSFSEALAEELKGSGCSVTALCPGPTESGFQKRARMEDSRLVRGKALPDAGSVARLGIEAALRGEPLVVPGLANKLQTLVPRILPRAIVPRIVLSAQE